MNKEKPSLKFLARMAKKRMRYIEMMQEKALTPIDRQFEALKDKARKLIEADRDTTAPIKKLIDYEVYDKLNQIQRDKYILDLIEVYTKMKSQIEKREAERELA
ncbi:MAG: hypothetical protein IKT27_01040 [Clostridia bacterium]|nr:hypothetical protein [Clostridia bacterium]